MKIFNDFPFLKQLTILVFEFDELVKITLFESLFLILRNIIYTQIYQIENLNE